MNTDSGKPRDGRIKDATGQMERNMEATTWFSVYTDDGAEPNLLLDRGVKQDVFETLGEYDPQTVRVIEFDRDDDYAQQIEALNGEEWLHQNDCPTCGRHQN